MGRLTEDMTRLSGEIDLLRRQRATFHSDLKRHVAEMKSQVAQMESNFREARHQMSSETKAQLHGFVAGVKGAVDTIRGEASQMQSNFRKAHAEMARNTKDNRMTFISDLKATVTHMQSGFYQARQEMSRGTKAELGECISGVKRAVRAIRDETSHMQSERLAFISDLKTDTTELKSQVGRMQAGFRAAHDHMSRETKADLSQFVSGMKQAVGLLREEAADMQSSFRSAYAEMAGKSRAERLAFIPELKGNVTEMQSRFRNGYARRSAEMRADLMSFVHGLKEFTTDLKGKVSNLRQEFAQDLNEARRAWSGPTPVEARVTVEVTPKAAREEVLEAETTPKEAKIQEKIEEKLAPPEVETRPETEEATGEIIRDNLTTIQGIGQGMQRQLNKAGIYTYEQLAASTHEELNSALGKVARFADVEKWIEQAREFAREKKGGERVEPGPE